VIVKYLKKALDCKVNFSKIVQQKPNYLNFDETNFFI
jgi:hypothetical protein